MAQPVSIFTSPSTTFVQVDSLQSPYTPVILNTVSYLGQTLTVLNTQSSLNIFSNPIVVSTIAGASYSDGTTRTLIQQPQGYVTAQTVQSNQWVYLNSYPFRDQYISAGVQTLTTSTLYTALISTIQDITSSMRVENLVVSGNFFQSSGLILNTSVSSLGAVTIVSSLTVNGTTFFQSSVSSFGLTVFQSTLTVGGNFFSRSSIVVQNQLNISTSLHVLNEIDISGTTRPIRIGNGLVGSALEVQTSSPTAMNVGGSFFSQGSLSSLSSLTLGGALFLRDLYVAGNLSSLSSVAIADPIEVGNNSLFKQGLTVGGKLGIGNSLSVGDGFTVSSLFQINQNLTIENNFTTLSTMSTGYLYSDFMYIQGDLTVFSTPFVSTQSLVIRGSLGFQDMASISTSIGGNVSTFSNLLIQKSTFLYGYTTIDGSISTLSSFTVGQDASVLGNLSVGKSLALVNGMSVYGNITVQDTFSTNALQPDFFLSSVIEKNLSIEGSLSVRDIAILSSIVLPSSVLANNFVTQTFGTGYQGITSNLQVSSLFTSSLTTGGLLQAQQTMDMANVLETRNLSTFLLSSLKLQVGATSQPSTFVQFQSSFGIQKEADLNTFDVNTILYTLNNTYIDKHLSSLQIVGNQVQGTFTGDGFLLSNINYPARLSTFGVSTSQMIVEKTFLSTMVASSGTVTDTFIPYSTLRVGDFYIFGNAKQDLSLNSNVLQTIQNNQTTLLLNNMYIYGDTQSIVPRQVVINSNILPSLSNIYKLGVGGTLRTNSILSPEFVLYIQTYTGEIVVGVNVGSLQTNTMYISSGIMGRDSGTFFLPDGYTPLRLSTNIVQPILSTLVFNSTLIVDRQQEKVGVNTKPFYALDVFQESYAQQGLLASYSTTVESLININQQRSSFWLAVTSNTSFSNVLFSQDKGETWDFFTPTSFAQGATLLTVATNGGQLSLSSSNTLLARNLWITGGAALPQYYDEGSSSWYQLSNTSKFPTTITDVAYNGSLWVLTGFNSSNLSPSVKTLHWSSNGIDWNAAQSGGFGWDGATSTYGGQSVAWNGSLWVAVGEGSNLSNSTVYSRDGKNWSDAATGGLSRGYGVTWTGTNWVATGSGALFSSFCVSTDGFNWTRIGGGGLDQGNAIASDGRIVVAVGTARSSDPIAQTIQYSTDGGTTWSNASGSLFDRDTNTGVSVVYNGEYWLAGGRTGLRKSTDGINWFQPVGAPASLAFQGLAFSSNALPLLQIGASNYTSTFASTILTTNVACGIATDTNCLRYSTDGINWDNAVSGYFIEQGRAAAHNGTDLWVAAGRGVASNYIYSRDGRTWSDGFFLDPVGTFAIGTGLAYGGGYWVGTMDLDGGGGNSLFYSSDGSNWYAGNEGTDFTTAGYGIAFGNGKYVAVGEGGNTILYAQTLAPPDTWTATGMTNAFTTSGRGIAYGASVWVACGDDTGGKTIKYSTDQSNWTDATGSLPSVGYGVAYNGSNLWVVAGNGGASSNLVYSGDRINWSDANSGDFTVKAYGISYNQGLNLWMAAGEGPSGTTLKYSGDGSNWSNATGGFDTYGYGIGVYSNVLVAETIAINQLRVYNTPGYNVTTRDITPNISYTSTTLTLMDTLSVDRFKNVNVYSSDSPYLSSFYDPSLAFVSSFVSTQTSQVAGYFLTASLV